MCSTVFAPDAPGITVTGLNVATAPDGNPDADMMTTLLKSPPIGGTVTLISTDPPAFTVNGDCGALTAKVEASAATVTSTPSEVEAAAPAVPEYWAVIVFVPAG